MNLRLARKNREVNPESWDKLYDCMVVGKIRSKNKENHGMGLTHDNEIAMLRKEVARLTEAVQALKPSYTPSDEFASYNAGVEHCKTETKKFLSKGEGEA